MKKLLLSILLMFSLSVTAKVTDEAENFLRHAEGYIEFDAPKPGEAAFTGDVKDLIGDITSTRRIKFQDYVRTLNFTDSFEKVPSVATIHLDDGKDYAVTIDIPAALNKYTSAPTNFDLSQTIEILIRNSVNSATLSPKTEIIEISRDKNLARIRGRFEENYPGQGLVRGRFIIELKP